MGKKEIKNKIEKELHKAEETAWYSLSAEAVAKKTGTSLTDGLANETAAGRLRIYGHNLLPEEEVDSYLTLIVRQVRSPLVYILLFAAFITLLLGHYSDLIIILLTVAINVVVGFLQERRAGNTLAALKKTVKPEAKVLRDGHVTEMIATELVPGDVILLRAGDKVPADARLIEEEEMEVVEAALTGESVPAKKDTAELKQEVPLADQENMVFMGTEVAFGKGRAIVVATGLATELGKIASMLVSTRKQETPLQRSLASFSRWLAVLTVILSFLLLIVGIAQQRDFLEMLVTAVAVAVSAVPEALLISLTVILAVGMQRILQKRGLARNLAAAETLGSTSVICTDKTGTLTIGEMRVASLVSASEELHIKKHLSEAQKSKELVNILRYAFFANETIVENPEDNPRNWKMIGSLTDKALYLAAAEIGLRREHLDKEFPQIAEDPFDEKSKYAASLRHFSARQNIVYVKGAAEILLNRSKHIDVNGKPAPDGPEVIAKLQKKFEEMTRRGLRVLGVAYAKTGSNVRNFNNSDALLSKLVFAGFIGLRDPIREEVPATIKLARKAGVRTVMVTGDHKFTALAIAREAGMESTEDNVISGADLDNMDDQHLSEQINKIDIFSRVSPTHKLRIIEAWQARGDVVAMSGDGVNDAPALKKADIGVAVGSGTEVARSAADLVLLDDNFRTIVAAVEQGRIIFNNIRRVILFLLFDAYQELILVAGSIMLGLPMPILPGQILWNNVVNNGFPNLALTIEEGERDVMAYPPRARKEPIVSKQMKWMIMFVGTIVDLLFLGLFIYWLKIYEIEVIRTLIFVLLGISSLFSVFSLKNLFEPIWRIKWWSNIWLVVAVLVGLAVQLAAVYAGPLQALLRTVPLPASYWIWLTGLSLCKLFAIEISKAHFRKKHKLIDRN